MGQPAYELVLAVIAIVLITAGYVVLAGDEVPAPSSAIGYGLGVTGFLMMLSTETLYSIRKRLPNFHFGPMSLWLQAHVFTGLVGPYLVLLHSGWRFSGLAGFLTLITGVVVVSGVIGRYIYTAVPRNLEGAEVAMYELEEQIVALDRQLESLGVDATALGLTGDLPQGWVIVLARPWFGWRQKRQVHAAIQKLDSPLQEKAAELEKLLTDRQRLDREMRSLEATRRLLALWHLFHVPLSAGLFALAFIHIGGALYYAALTR